MENYIKEAKRGFSIGRIATSDFTGNEIDLLIKLQNAKEHHCPFVTRYFTPILG